MNEIQILKESVKSVLRELKDQQYSNSTVGSYSAIYNEKAGNKPANMINHK